MSSSTGEGAGPSGKSSGSSGHASNELDCTNAGRGVWLVKVPKYISQRWEKQKPMTEVGRLKITTGAMAKPDIFFNLSEEIIKTELEPVGSTPSTATTTTTTSKVLPPIGEVRAIPAEHKFAISDIKQQTLAVFSQDDSSKVLALEGHVVQKGECRPIANTHYMSLKRESIRKASQPSKVVQKIDRAVNNFKPINVHKSEIENEQRKKAEGKKMRDDRDIVKNTLFASFERHQYYNIKDLERITKQPVPYLKEILKEICNYNAKNPHKNMWELKPEFRHYNSSSTKAED